MTTVQLLLVQLMEECAEVSQRASKAIRFGLKECEPEQNLDNEARLEQEVCDLMGILEELEACNVMCAWVYKEQKHLKIAIKRKKIQKFLQYSREQGILNDSA